MKHAEIVQRFEAWLKTRSLKLTRPRRRILDRAFATHAHFSAEELHAWLAAEEGEGVSRATVYRTLSLLSEAGFLQALDAERGVLVYEHVLGHHHHDHMLCVSCGRIEEFHDERIEELQLEACRRKGWRLVSHDLRLRGLCRRCIARPKAGAGKSARPVAARGPSVKKT
jgi:Fur family ferric uptake transcriptional regulator